MAFTFELIPLVLLILFSYLTFVAYKKRQISKIGLIAWEIIWAGSITLILFHSFFNQFLYVLNFSRVFDLYTLLAFTFILFVVFYLFRRISQIESKIEEITRTLAFNKSLKEMKKIG